MNIFNGHEIPSDIKIPKEPKPAQYAVVSQAFAASCSNEFQIWNLIKPRGIITISF